MPDSPRVSVIVTAHNIEKYLPRCIASLLDQTERSLEVILVDDGSTDATPALVKEYASTDPRVRKIVQRNGGVSAARNTGFRAAVGEFVWFVDGDDWVEPTTVELMLKRCEQAGSSVAIAGAHVDFHDQDDRLVRSEKRRLLNYEIRRGVPVDDAVFDDNLVNLLGYVWNKIYRRDWLERTGIRFDEALNLFEDIEFNVQALASAEGVVLVPEALVHYVQRPRLTLGTTLDDSFLTKRLRAINSVDSLLQTWGVGEERRAAWLARAAGMALWTALRVAANGPNPKAHLRTAVKHPATGDLIRHAGEAHTGNWRGSWAANSLKHEWFGIALLPVRLSGGLARQIKLSERVFKRQRKVRGKT